MLTLAFWLFRGVWSLFMSVQRAPYSGRSPGWVSIGLYVVFGLGCLVVAGVQIVNLVD